MLNKRKRKRVEIFTDGACKGNPGPGGWAAILRYKETNKEIYGAEPYTTNNRMELTAVTEALKALKEPCEVVICTDSQYVRKGIKEWLSLWKKRNWMTTAGTRVKNIDLWKSLEKEANRHEVNWKWVKGHSGLLENERCDELAKKAINSIKK